ncbi:MAG: class I SAM-dependent methyltransferase [Thaumarchaeota archaeon]|nr:class I SAM-dependent methyltransferase [Nitrososphaerota archaeon]
MYSRYRPGYPPEILDVLRKEIGFQKNEVVADIGSGTGLLTKLFLSNGNRVFAVEPNARMRYHADRDFAGFTNFASVAGKAERTKLRRKSIDLITAGEALHWFNASRTTKEFSRIARPGCHLCVVYTRSKTGGKLTREYLRFINKYQHDLAKVPEMNRKLVSPYFRGGKFLKFKLSGTQALDIGGLRGKILSFSFMPTPEEAERSEAFNRALKRLYNSNESDGQVRFFYETTVLLGEPSN